MSKESDLEKQLAELKQSKAFLLNKLDECMRLPDKAKAAMWDAVTPLIKVVVENKIKGGSWDRRDLGEIVLGKILVSILGTDADLHLGKL